MKYKAKCLAIGKEEDLHINLIYECLTNAKYIAQEISKLQSKIWLCNHSVKFSSIIHSCPTLQSHGCNTPDFTFPSPALGILFKLMSIKLVMPSNHLILCSPLLLPSIFPSIRDFSNESVLLIR